jgi:hypothetical protein
MAQLLLQGTNFMNFMGRYVYVATGKKGFEAIAVAEHDEPEAILGSDLQRIAYPDNYKKFVSQHRELSAAAEHTGNVLDIQGRGEYAYAANGPGGLRVYESRMVTQFFREGQHRTGFTSGVSLRRRRAALAVASPTTRSCHPLRSNYPRMKSKTSSLWLCTSRTRRGLVIRDPSEIEESGWAPARRQSANTPEAGFGLQSDGY